MGRLVGFLVFFVTVLALLGAIHYYLWLRLVHGLGLSPAVELWLSWLSVLLFVSIPLTLLGGRFLPRALTRLWLRPSYVWLGMMWLLLVVVLGVDLLRGLAHLGRGLVGTEASLLWFASLERSYGFLTIAVGAIATGLALLSGARFQVRRVEVPLAKLAPALDGLTIVQISDVHVGPTIGLAFMERVVASINRLEPDLVAITGDLVDGPVGRLAPALEPLRRLSARHGVYFVTGNHEYYSGAPEWCEHLTGLGVRVLRNERVSIERGGAAFDLAGIDDYQGKQFGHGHGADLRRAVAGRDETRALVLLAHQPRAIQDARRHGVDLQLSGHTHGGQIWPFNFLVKLQQPVVSGLHRLGETALYVSNGTGHWGPPMRLAAPAEVTQLVLRAGSGAA